MSRNITPLAFVALVVVAAAIMAALARSDSIGPTVTTGPSPPERRELSEPARRAPADPAVDTARRFALAARNWTPATYPTSWERQIELAGGGYRRALVAKRPGRRELVALREDRARSKARVLVGERDRRVPAPAARVLVTLDETTNAGGQTIRGPTLNEVRLRRHGARWRVVGWTVLPGG